MTHAATSFLRCTLPTAVLLVGACGGAADPDLSESSMTPSVATGDWLARLDTPGGPLRFGLAFHDDERGLAAWLVNGDERSEVPRLTREGDRLTLHIDHYDSRLTAMLSDGGRRLTGTWNKRRSADTWADLAFAAAHASVAEPLPWIASPDAPSDEDRDDFSGRFAVRFDGDDDPAVGLFDVAPDGTASGTFLTSTGDYRYLSGGVTAPGALELSAFDGAHAFLFRMEPSRSGLAGRFWSGDWFETGFVATPDPDAAVPDPLSGTALRGDAGQPLDLGALRFPDLDGVVRGLDDPAFAGRARLVQLFGSWCPNCADACELLVELQAAYGDRGLSIVGLAFEVTGDAERDAAQVRAYAARHGVAWPLLVAGLSDKAEASRRVPFLDKVRSFPTTVFLHGDGRVRAVWQGFSGPATGTAHAELRATYAALIEELLAEDVPAQQPAPVGGAGN